MTQSSLKYIFLLLKTLCLLANCCNPVKTLQVDPNSHELQCNESTIIPADNYTRHEIISCGLNSKILVKLDAYYDNYDELFLFNSEIQFNCYNATPLKISLPLKMPEYLVTVHFNSCRFSANDDILKILKDSLKLSSMYTVSFDNELVLSRAHLKPLVGLVKKISFNIKNLSTLPMDLFNDFKTLKVLSISSDKINSSYVSNLLAPLENLSIMILEINGSQELSGSIFAHAKNLTELHLHNSSFILAPNCLSHLCNLEEISFDGNYLSSLPNDVFRETKKLQVFSLTENKVKLKQLPKGLLRDLPLLCEVKIIGCGLESIPADIFKGSKRITNIDISGNNLHELPLKLFADQEELFFLDLSKNMIQTLIEGLFACTKNLKDLFLSDNQLTNLSKNIFKALTSLRLLDLANNNLLTISLYYNQPQLGSIFDSLPNLEFLSLKNNSINETPSGIMNTIKFMNIDLSFNKISTINCKFVRYFDFVRINITENPIYCDSKIICLYQYVIQTPMADDSWLKTIRCEFPNTLKGRLLYSVSLNELLSWPDIRQSNISKRCAYKIRTLDSVLVMNCTNGNFTDIPMLPMPDADQSFSNGIELIMDNNPLTELSNEILKHNTNITLFRLCDSQIAELPKGFLSKMAKLKTVFLVFPLKEISEDFFFESHALLAIKISGTKIKSLPYEIFANQDKLIHVDLSRNKLESFDLNALNSNPNLETLILSHNFITSFGGWLKKGFPKLKKLFLDNNSLKFIHFFPYNSPSVLNLEYLNLENNKLWYIGSLEPYSGKLQKLLLKNNFIADVYIHNLKAAPAYIDFSLNKINSIDLDYIGSTNFNTTILNISYNDIRSFTLKYRNISFKCSCESNCFVKGKNLKNIYESVRCLSPNNLIDRHISYIPQNELLCPACSFCPESCQCWFRPANSILIVNCSNANLTEAPSLFELGTTFQDGIELFIEYNHLSSLKLHSPTGYKGVTKIFAAHNNITKIYTEDIPENLTVLDISYNQLERIDQDVIQVIKESRSLKSILLHHNPIVCDCSSENLTNFILRNKLLFHEMTECGDGQKLSALSFKELCFTEPSNTGTMIWILFLITLCVLLFLTVVYLKNTESILIWLYAHNLCLCCVTEEELDKDKKYDAFISYSSLDAEFVALNLVSKLESGPNPYKLCLHDRDWLGGGYIPHQIEKSVDRSRRTLIVMSQNYINSRWTRMEFRTAHNASMNEKRPRVIVVMIDDKVDLKDLDSDLRKYIKMYTYLRWGDAWFWDRLKYALPHPSKKNHDIKKYNVRMSELGGAEAGTGYSSDENELF